MSAQVVAASELACLTVLSGNFPLGLAKDGAMMQEMRGPDEHRFGARISCIMAPSLANPRGKLPVLRFECE